MCIVYVCYQMRHFPLKHAVTPSPTITPSPTVTPSPTGTQSPAGTMGGFNAAAVAIPVVLGLLLLLVIGVVVGLFLYLKDRGME